MSETYTVSKKEFLEFQVHLKELEIEKLEAQIEEIKAKKAALSESIAAIKADNRDVFPARGRKAKQG